MITQAFERIRATVELPQVLADEKLAARPDQAGVERGGAIAERVEHLRSRVERAAEAIREFMAVAKYGRVRRKGGAAQAPPL